MRRLMWFTIGFAAACAIGAYLYTDWLLLAAAAAVGLCVTAWVFKKRFDWLRRAAAAFLGLSLGLGWFCGYHALYLGTARSLDGQTLSLEAVASDYSYASGYGCAVEAELCLEGKHYQALLYLRENKSLNPGDEIHGQFRLRLTHEGKEGDTYHRGNGVFLLAYAQEDCKYLEGEDGGIRYLPARICRDLTERLDSLFPEDTAFFAKALLLGERSDMDYQINTALKVSGISHVVAVSGLHISILFSMLSILCVRRRWLLAIFGIPVLLLFAAVVGFTPSITRACLMQILMIISMLVDREYDAPTSLSFASLVMLAVNPVVITSASFQLSVGCMAGIFLFSQRIQEWILDLPFWEEWKGKSLKNRFRNGFATGVSVTLSAMFFTTPLSALYFDTVSLVSILTNLLTLWAVTWVFYGIVAVCLLSMLWSQGAALLAWLFSWLIRYVLLVAKLLASIPLAAVYAKSVYVIIWIVLCYVLVFVLLRMRVRRPELPVCCCVIGLCAALCLSWAEPLTDSCRMTVLDVGQGQSILLQARGKTFLVDCGGDSDAIAADEAAETLLSMGIARVDGVILTHYDEDHAGGIAGLLSRVSADAVYLPRESDDMEIQSQVLEACADAAVFVEEDLELCWDTGTMTIFAPLGDSSDNERSLCVLFREENCDILITGDMGTASENRLLLQKNIPELTVLVAGHHGSKYSTGEALLAATTPEYVMISVGEGNSYGHPSREVLSRLEEYGCIVQRTDQDGTIVFRR